MAKVLCIGDVMLDVIAVLQTKMNYGSDTPSSISTHGGGAAGNVASWASVCGAATRIVVRVGNDPAGRTILSEFDALGVEHNHGFVPDAQTGVVVVLVDLEGERSMFPETGANSGLSLADLPPLDGIEVAYLSGYALLDERSRDGVLDIVAELRAKAIPIFFDPATVGGMSQVPISEIRQWLLLMSVLFMNEEEACYLTGKTSLEDALNALLEFAPQVVIKCGADGAIGQGREDERIQIPAIAASVVDTTGAGDSFAGGFIASWLLDTNLRRCMEAGALAAAQCVSIVGARPQVTAAH